ncbi:MAG: PilN domain-containing protein [Armatimonadota bacterium]
MMININLIAERRARKLREMATLRWSIIGLVLLFLLMLGLNIATYFDWQSNRKQLAIETDRLAVLKAKYEELQEIEKEIAEKGPIVNLLDQVRISEQSWMIILADISRIIPHDASIAGITTMGSRDGMRLRFSGLARDLTTAGDFMRSFSKQTSWADTPADLSGISTSKNRDEGERVRFDFTVSIRGMLGGEF